MMALVKDRWTALTANERALIAVAAALALVLAGATLVLAPLRTSHEEARRDYQSAARTLDEVRAGIAGATARGPAVDASGDARGVVTGAALARGLAIARMSPVERGGLSVRLEQADPVALYAWLSELEASHGVVVRRANVRRVDGGERVEADLVLSGGGST